MAVQHGHLRDVIIHDLVLQEVTGRPGKSNLRGVIVQSSGLGENSIERHLKRGGAKDLSGGNRQRGAGGERRGPHQMKE